MSSDFRPTTPLSSAQDADALVEQLKSSSATVLDLHELNIDDNAFVKLLPLLVARSDITTVNLLGNPLGVQSLIAAFQALQQRFVILKYNWLDPNDILREAKARVPHGQLFNPQNDKFLQGYYAYLQAVLASLTRLKNPPPLVRVELLPRLANYIAFRLFVAAHPQVTQIDIKRPLIITGMFRTGTTFLLNLLASVDGVRSPRLWETEAPVPPPEPETYASDPRIAQTNQQLERVFYRMMPELRKYHNMQADWPEECLFILKHKFIFFDAYYSNVLPSYTQWFEAIDHVEAYKEHKLHLQVLSSKYPPASHWLLKSPQHLNLLDSLDVVYPDSNIVFCHRDPVECLASGISLFTYGGICYANDYDRVKEGKRYFQLLAAAWKRAIKLIKDWEAAGKSHRILHTYYKETIADPVTACRRIHEHFGYAVPENFEDGIRKWLADNPQGKYGAHKYALEEFGLSKEDVYTEFAEYYQLFFPDQLPK